MKALRSLHGRLVYDRRTRVLAARLAELLPRDAQALDVGCGDGRIDRLILERRPDVAIEGIDVRLRPDAQIPVSRYDGLRIPRADGEVDAVLLVDVLHHAERPEGLLREALRVAKRAVLVKDHTRNGILAGPTLRLMDWVGNAPHGVALRYDYWRESLWRETFRNLEIRPAVWERRLGLYPRPASWIFDRSLHFVALFDLTRSGG